MKRFSFLVLTALLMIGPVAKAHETIMVPIKVSAQPMTPQEKRENTCYRLAAQGRFVREDIVRPLWYQSNAPFKWRITSYSSGLTCKVLVAGRYNMQFGPGADKTSCFCEGMLEVAK